MKLNLKSINKLNRILNARRAINTVGPVYSELGYSEYPLIGNWFLRLGSLIYSQIKYVYSEYLALVDTFCCTDPFTINGIDFSIIARRLVKKDKKILKFGALLYDTELYTISKNSRVGLKINRN
jgi:hypothetical protein